MSMRHLERKLDPEACRRIRLGIKPHSEPLPAKRLKPIRKAKSYRAAKRNQVRIVRLATLAARREARRAAS